MIIDKQSRVRYPTAKHIGGDLVVDAAGPVALSQEVVPVIGGWKDYTGSGGVPTKQLTMMRMADKLFGTDAWVEGARLPDIDVLGNIKRITRLRRKKKILQLPF